MISGRLPSCKSKCFVHQMIYREPRGKTRTSIKTHTESGSNDKHVLKKILKGDPIQLSVLNSRLFAGEFGPEREGS